MFSISEIGVPLTVNGISQLLATRQQFDVTAVVCICVALDIAVHVASTKSYTLSLTAV